MHSLQNNTEVTEHIEVKGLLRKQPQSSSSSLAEGKNREFI
jgi:hypothetical protein